MVRVLLSSHCADGVSTAAAFTKSLHSSLPALHRDLHTGTLLTSYKGCATPRNGLCRLGADYLVAAQASKDTLHFWTWHKVRGLGTPSRTMQCHPPHAHTSPLWQGLEAPGPTTVPWEPWIPCQSNTPRIWHAGHPHANRVNW